MEIAANQKKIIGCWRQASMQVLNSSVARPWKLEQNTSGQASRQASRASRRWKLEQKNMTKKGPFFGPQNERKSRRAEMGLPSSSLSILWPHKQNTKQTAKTNSKALRADFCQNCLVHAIITSSTAQGSGGSFKNRKPIGEVSCCESGLAERSH